MRLKLSILLLHCLFFKISTVALANHVDTVRIRKDLLKITQTPHTHYHLPSDSIGTFNLPKMSAVLESVYMALVSLNSG